MVRADGRAAGEDVADRVRARERGARAVLTWKGGWVQDPAAAEVQAPGGEEATTDGEASAVADRGGASAGPRVR